MLDLPACHRPLTEELQAAFRRVLDSGRFILGPEVEGLEKEVGELLGLEYSIGMSSGTDALIAALMALDIGVGDEVLCPTFTFFATGGSVSRLGATPVFVDADATTFNSRAEDFEAKITKRTRALIVVHLYGRCADMGPILELAKRHGLAVIEDTAQALGATTSDGHPAGSLGTLGTFSFFPTKNLGGLGDAGLVATADAALGARLRSVRTHGESSKYHHSEVGGNFRIDAMQAALLRVKLPHLAAYNEARRENASLYCEILGQLADVASAQTDSRPDGELTEGVRVVLPDISDPGHIYHQFVLRIPDDGRGDSHRSRDSLRSFLAEQSIQTEVYYPIPLHLQPCFADLGDREGSLPVSERLAQEVLALPIFPELGRSRIVQVCDGIAAWLKS